MNIFNVPHPRFNSNSWIIEKGGECVIVDTNHLTDKVLVQKGLNPVAVIITHEHFDHIESLNEIREKYEIPLYASSWASEGIQNERINLSVYYYGNGYECKPADIIIEDGCEYKLLGEIFRFYISQGHSEGSILACVDDKLFTGDTLLEGIKIETKLPGADRKSLTNSLELIRDSFADRVTAYPGHGEPFFLSTDSVMDTAIKTKLELQP